MEHTPLKIDFILLTLVIRFIFWNHVCSSNQNSKDVKGYESEEHQHTPAEEHSLCKSHTVGVKYTDMPSSLERYKLSLFILVMLPQLCFFSQNWC